MSNKTVSLILDTTVAFGDDKALRNLSATRTSKADKNGYLDDKTLRIPPNESVSIDEITNCIAFNMVSDKLVDITGQVIGNNNATDFRNTKNLSMTTGLIGVTISNNSATETATVRVTRLGTLMQNGPIPDHDIFFAPFGNITAIGYAVTNLSRVYVQTIALSYLENDQVSAPAAGLEAYRICDSNGTANPNGAYLMYLNTTATSSNSTGNLFLSIREVE